MTIGIDASRAFLKNRTGIEEYSYQVIKHLRSEIPSHQSVILYIRKKFMWEGGRCRLQPQTIDFALPLNWQVKALWAPRFWTQIRLSLEMLFDPVDTLFVPAHTIPVIHPKHTVVTIHGLEYEFSPESYSWYERFYMRFSIRNSVRWAQKVIAVSENTKRDLMRLYQVPVEKISVIYEGFQKSEAAPASSNLNNQAPYFLFIGRVEERKNVSRIIEAFTFLKEKTELPHRLLLAGKPGYGYEKIKSQLEQSVYQDEIQELGYVSEEEKWALLQKTDALLFPSLYEGFGLPILEAQAVGVPVITSTTSSLPEIAGEGALLVDPLSTEALIEAMERVVTNRELRAGIIDKGTHNVGYFSWQSCSHSIAQILE